MKNIPENYRTLPLIPLREMVIFPSTLVPFLIGRHTSLSALDMALTKDKALFLTAQLNPTVDLPKPKDMYTVGVEARVVQTAQSQDNNVKVVVEAIRRARVVEYVRFYPYYEVLVKELPQVSYNAEDFQKHFALMMQLFKEFMALPTESSLEAIIPAAVASDPQRIVDIVSSQLPLPLTDKQNLLEIINPLERVFRLTSHLREEIRARRERRESSPLSRKEGKKGPIPNPASPLPEEEDIADNPEIEALRQKIEKSGMPEAAREKALKELERLEMMPPSAAEATVSRSYVDWMVALPWRTRTKEMKNLKEARRILESEHFGLEKVKERILEFLAVRHLVKVPKSPILCFVGPPGVGKSSLAQSIAKAMGRKFVHLSLGGVRDEAEIKGHRRTYIGSYPGQIVHQIKRAGARNPVFLLDEVDKMTSDFRGDPAAALLEVLDPEQNKEFVDRYLDVEFDLSDVFFITTANNLQPVPAALVDRMEVIEIPGYTELEKLKIAQNYLLKKQKVLNGLKEQHLELPEETLEEIIRRYTRESGVRNLERMIGKVCRRVAFRFVESGKKENLRIERDELKEYLGVPKHRLTAREEKEEVGVVTGLAWTEVGGDLLTFEVRLIPGKGELRLTGRLGEVMQESAQTAFSYVKSHLGELKYDLSFLKEYDIHIHVPEGAVPKEGPSAGVTIATALISLVLGLPVGNNLAMTGEITLRGRVLPIGGLKEKLVAAHREHVETVLIPFENEAELKEVPEEITRDLKIQLVKSMDEVFRLVFRQELKKGSHQLPAAYSYPTREKMSDQN